MAEKSKHLCKWRPEQIAAQLPKFSRMVRQPRFVCLRCGRAAAKKKWLCKPSPLG